MCAKRTRLKVDAVIFLATLNPSLGLKPKQGDVPTTAKIIFQVVTSVIPLAVLITAVLERLLFGLATSAEAAGVGVRRAN